MIPLRDENPTRTTPYIVFLLIAANVFFYVIDTLGAHLAYGRLPMGALWNYSMVPRQVLTNNPNLPILIQNLPPIPHISPMPVWITIFTSMFLHGGIVHLGGNMLYLWIFGNNIEDVLGHAKFLLFYLVGGVVAALAHIASNPNSMIPTVGASGAIAAVLGAYIILYPNSRVTCLVFLGFLATVVPISAVFVLGLWILLQIFNVMGGGMVPGAGGVAFWAHIGGFAAGMVGILLLGGRGLLRGNRNGQNLREYWYEDR